MPHGHALDQAPRGGGVDALEAAVVEQLAVDGVPLTHRRGATPLDRRSIPVAKEVAALDGRRHGRAAPRGAVSIRRGQRRAALVPAPRSGAGRRTAYVFGVERCALSLACGGAGGGAGGQPRDLAEYALARRPAPHDHPSPYTWAKPLKEMKLHPWRAAPSLWAGLRSPARRPLQLG